MEIKEYIKDLLYTNQGVIIPGLGGFVSEYESAEFDVNENKFLPPSKKILFNKNYSFKDNLLVKYISKKENLDQEKAQELIDKFVKEVLDKLKTGEKFDFKGIGTLSQTSKGEIIFEQNKELNLLTDAFGLKSVKSKPIEKEKEKSFKPQKTKKSHKRIFIISSILTGLVLVIVLAWFITDGFTDYNLNNSQKETISQAKPDIGLINTEKNLDSIAKADSIKALINKSIDENTNKKDALFYNEPKKTNDQAKPQYSKFYIIAGSFKRMSNAEKFSNQLKSKGYNPEIIQSNQELFRIAINQFSDETSALKELYRLRDQADIKSVWILKTN